MTTYGKILLATDGSEQGGRAAAEAVRLARLHHAQLHVVHVEVIGRQGMDTFTDPVIPDYVRTLGQLIPGAELELNHKDTVVRVVRDRSEVAGILRYAADQAVDLIVVGTHGRSAISEMLLGSVAQAVVREAPVPVLVVGARAAARPEGPGAVLAPVDFSPGSAAALARAAELATQRDARLIALHVVDFSRLPHPEDLDIGERERRTRAELQSLAASAGLPGSAETLVTVGPAAEEIVRIAAKFNASLIVMAASSLTALERLMLGSVYKPVIRHAPCPVLVHRPTERPAQKAAA